MKKNEQDLRLAHGTGVSPAEAADQVDIALHDILKQIGNGKRFRLPGLGTFSPGGIHTGFQFTGYAKSKTPRSRNQGLPFATSRI